MILPLPDHILTEAELDRFLAEPYAETVEMMGRMTGDIMILGAGGKMGPSLAKLAATASLGAGAKRRVIAVSRFANRSTAEGLRDAGVDVISCDLLDVDALRGLPKAEHVIFMAGRKFGERGSESLTWLSNVILPFQVAQTFQKSNIVAFSTGCVYALVKRESGGSRESDPAAPIGEYASSCLGRERVFQHVAETVGTRVLLYRLNYAIDLRYGVLHDIAAAVQARRPVDLSVAEVNVIWQGDANNRALLCLEHTANPPTILNVTGPEILDVKSLARQFGSRFGVEPSFVNEDAEARAYLSDASRSIELFGPPRISIETMIEWTADWIARGGRSLGKPTHFQVTDGQFLD